MQFSFAGDNRQPFVLVRSDNAALLSIRAPAFALTDFLANTQNWFFGPYPDDFPAKTGHCPWAPSLPDGAVVALPGYSLYCALDDDGFYDSSQPPCAGDGDRHYATLAEAWQACHVADWCRFIQVIALVVLSLPFEHDRPTLLPVVSAGSGYLNTGDFTP